MSETPPVPPATKRHARPKRRSLTVWIAVAVILVLLAIVCLLTNGVVELRDGPRPHDGMTLMSTALRIYADDNIDHLPPTLRAMIPVYLSEKNYDDSRYEWPRKSGRHDWLYYPREKLDGLPQDTIILASPVILLNTSEVQLRIVSKADGSFAYIPEADFQRLIREQNPPASSPPPNR